MTAQPAHDRLDRSPTWTIQGVFDPDETGQDFSYTIGLHDLGLPELHLWASPTDGHDPGDGWAFSPRDRSQILNDLAFSLVDGRVAPGSRWVERFDGGHVSVAFEIQPPGDRNALEAWGIVPGARILPVTWSLDRPPLGEAAPLSPQQRMLAFDEYADLARNARAGRGVTPEGWALPSFPRFDPGDRFGPLTPLVLARAAQLWSSTDLVPWIEEALAFHDRGGLMWPATIARTIARPLGRTAALHDLEEALPAVVAQGLTLRQADWEAAVARVAQGHSCGLTEHGRLGDAAQHALTEMSLGVLALEVVADVADRDLRLYARGPWMLAAHPHRAVPGDGWAAGPRVVRAVRKLLRPLSLRDWSALLIAHAEADDPMLAEVCWELRLRYATTASAMPWSKLADLPAAREFRDAVSRGVEFTPMVEWASALAALMTFRAEFSADQAGTYVRPCRDLLPDLARVVNQVR